VPTSSPDQPDHILTPPSQRGLDVKVDQYDADGRLARPSMMSRLTGGGGARPASTTPWSRQTPVRKSHRLADAAALGRGASTTLGAHVSSRVTRAAQAHARAASKGGPKGRRATSERGAQTPPGSSDEGEGEDEGEEEAAGDAAGDDVAQLQGQFGDRPIAAPVRVH
tara:strand:+ start:418 stop:918 length:501 start_codon:yes stop_codon:yes gene_type:complete